MRPALLLLATAASAEEPLVPTFVDETVTSGVTTAYRGEWEFMVGGGVAAFDCSGDRVPELYIAGGESPAALWLNGSEPGGALRFRAVESGAELDRVTGAYPLDVDSDGLTDLVVLRSGEDVLLRGLGDCRFERANELWAFDGGDLWSTAFAATWERGQAWPTLAIGSYIDRTEDLFPWGSCTENRLFRPGGEGYGPAIPLDPGFCALSMLFTDWNRSGQPALRVSNDREYYKGGQEQLWHLDPGAAPRLYTEAEGWARLRIWGMGIASGDLTGDGFPDYFLTSMADSKLQVLADGPDRPAYADIAYPRGVTAHRPYAGDDLRPSTGWHAQIEDVNADGLGDIFVVKGNVDAMPDFAQADPNNLLLQRADGTFLEAGALAGVGSTRTGRGGAVVDLNDDGRLDLVVVNRREGAELWRQTGPTGHWLMLALHQPGANRDAIGAAVEVRTGDRVQRREITSGGGHVSGQLGWWHVGLGDATEAEVRVTWPDGTVGDWAPVAADTFQELSPSAPPVLRER